jgi:hypothetical protein
MCLSTPTPNPSGIKYSEGEFVDIRGVVGEPVQSPFGEKTVIIIDKNGSMEICPPGN